MAIPDKPYTRKEQYLAAAAGGTSDIPAVPYTREEMYLDAIARSGGGGGAGILVVTATLVENNAKAATKSLGGGGGDAAQYRLDKTWQEIADADFAVIRAAHEGEGYEMVEIATVTGIGSMEGQYGIISSTATYTTDSADGYPVYTSTGT